ncbi:MAG: hypothetical protein EHM35_00595 [Planctomycetaceae bacterium]|nr:MAG: hypothetical protein EHM35_00595 [Planctomycetaceae bacterium]
MSDEQFASLLDGCQSRTILDHLGITVNIEWDADYVRVRNKLFAMSPPPPLAVLAAAARA